jgi:Trp operon repressor
MDERQKLEIVTYLTERDTRLREIQNELDAERAKITALINFLTTGKPLPASR